MKKLSVNGRIASLGWRSLLLLLVVLLIALKIWITQKKMNIITSIAEEIRELMVLEGFPTEMSKILVSQAAHETENFTSSVFQSNNNLFGMKFPQYRKTTAISKNGNYANYSCLKDSITDIKNYLDYNGLSHNYYDLEAYVKAIKAKGYFEDSEENYFKGVKHYYSLYYE